jgi:hypothetical protein
MKHVTASANSCTSIEDNIEELEKEQISESTPTSSLKNGKKSFHEQFFGIFIQMVENNSVMVKNFKKNQYFIEECRPKN